MLATLFLNLAYKSMNSTTVEMGLKKSILLYCRQRRGRVRYTGHCAENHYRTEEVQHSTGSVRREGALSLPRNSFRPPTQPKAMEQAKERKGDLQTHGQVARGARVPTNGRTQNCR